MELDRLVESLRKHPGMLPVDVTYNSVVAFLVGFDSGRSGGLLTGFQELVELKYGRRTKVHWSSLVPRLAAGDGDPTDLSDDRKIDRLLDLLDEFLTVDHGTIRSLRRLYSEWADIGLPDTAARDLQRFGSFPAPESITLAEAADRLGCSDKDILDMIRSRRITRVGRRGPEVMIPLRALEAATADTQSSD